MLKDLKTVEDLSIYLGVSVGLINFVVYVEGVDSFYEEFSLPKKSGGDRVISCPKGPLKKLQKRLQEKLSHEYNDRYGSFNVSQAFIKKRNIMSNAKVHRNKKFILNLDIEDFFDEFNFGRVYGYLQKSNDFKMNKQLSVILSKIFTYKNKLPQGSPSSPVLTNFIFRIVDFKILKLSKKYKLDYTRYADDMTFSTNDSNFESIYINFVDELRDLLHRQGFKINEKKTRLQFSSSKQEVTGLIVNKKINVSRKYYRDTRAQAYNMYKDGYYFIDGEGYSKLNKLEGRFSFINQVKRYNYLIDLRKYAKMSDDYSDFIESMTKYRHYPYIGGFDEQYRKFLFFKYFIHGPRPIILVEGKTDIRYIKAAMMKYYYKYPELIKKNNKGKFEFNVDFFKRGNEGYLKEGYKRNEIDYNIKDYYLGLSGEGAGELNKIVKYWGINKVNNKKIIKK
ncbi:reverse transcriptase domain-containing protein [Apilactobacillus sp. 1-1-2]|uniref:reverse transcriptase domain-containing protein n=1 Tax=Apilactobacillus sp. 1-1-2 TaxID=3411035 RepID=UPI003B92963E